MLIGAAINAIDASVRAARTWAADPRRMAIDAPDRRQGAGHWTNWRRFGFVDQIGRDHIHLSVDAAMKALGYVKAGGISGESQSLLPIEC